MRILPAGIGSEYGFGRRGGYDLALRRNGDEGFQGPTLVSCGRAALGLAIRAAKLGDFPKRNRVLLPSYLCRTMIQPFVEAGLEVKFYPAGQNLVIRAETVASHMDDQTLGILLVHYFGFPQNPGLAKRLHEAFPEVAIIDDRTHLLVSDVAGARGSSDPAIAVYSARKWGPFPDLGIVVWPFRERLGVEAAALLDRRYDLWLFNARLAGLLLRTAFFAFPCETLREVSLRWVKHSENIFDRRVLVSKASPLSRLLWRLWDWRCACQRRRQNFQYLLKDWPRQAGEPIYDSLPPDVCPLGFPIRAFDRKALRARLIANRVYPPVHWDLPKKVDPESFPESARLAKEELTLPIDQRYCLRDMDVILEVARAQ